MVQLTEKTLDFIVWTDVPSLYPLFNGEIFTSAVHRYRGKFPGDSAALEVTVKNIQL